MGDNLVLALFAMGVMCFALLLWAFSRRMQRSRTTLKWPQLALGNTLVLAFLISIILLAGEVYFRFVYASTDSLRYTKVFEKWMQRNWHPNLFGVRDNIEYAMSIQPGKR